MQDTTLAPADQDNEFFGVVNLAAAASGPAYPKLQAGRQWVSYDKNNDFPTRIVQINSKSPVNSSIIKSTVTYICGKGVRDTAKDGEFYVGRPNVNESWDDVVEPVATDYKTFGGFYLQVILNKESTTVSVYHQDFTTVRIGEVDEYGKPVTFRISNDWTKTSGKNKPLTLEAWPGMEEAKQGQQYIFAYWDYAPGLQVYCVPDWFAGADYVEADGLLAAFYKNSINNGFTPSVVVSMPNNPDTDKKKAFQRRMEDTFSGVKGASRILVLWGENENVKPTITPFVTSQNADVYNNVEAIVFQKIISSHRLSSPTLAGVSGSGNLSGNAAEIIDSYVLYNYTVVEKMRRKILDKLNIFQRINKVADLSIAELDVLPKIRQSDAAAPAEEVEEPATLSVKSPIEKAVYNVLKKLGRGNSIN